MMDHPCRGNAAAHNNTVADLLAAVVTIYMFPCQFKKNVVLLNILWVVSNV